VLAVELFSEKCPSAGAWRCPEPQDREENEASEEFVAPASLLLPARLGSPSSRLRMA